MFRPLFEASKTFFLFRNIVTGNSPFVRDSLDLKRFMSIVILSLIPPFIFGIYNAGWQSCKATGMPLDWATVFFQGAMIVLPLVMESYAGGFFWEILWRPRTSATPRPC